MVSPLRRRGCAARQRDPAASARAAGVAPDDVADHDPPLSLHRLRACVAPGHQPGRRAAGEAPPAATAPPAARPHSATARPRRRPTSSAIAARLCGYGTRPFSHRRTVLGSTPSRAATSSSRSRARSKARRSGSFTVATSRNARTLPTVPEDVPRSPSGGVQKFPSPAPAWPAGDMSSPEAVP